MAAQDVAALLPRVRRAFEGVPLQADDSSRLADAVLLPLAADAIADLILLTNGGWGHTLSIGEIDPETDEVTQWLVDPELTLPEQSLVAFQAALTYFFHVLKSQKVSERIANEGTEHEWSMSANAIRDLLAYLRAQRDDALGIVKAANPVFARVESLLIVRDRLAAAQLEPWTGIGVGGGMEYTR